MENMDVFDAEEAGSGIPTSSGDEVQKVETKVHQTIKKVTEDIGQRFHLNTAVSSIMELFNLVKAERDGLRGSRNGLRALKQAMENMLLLLSPFAPHFCEELWERTGGRGVLVSASWPDYDPRLAVEDRVTVVVQVNGKLRDRFEADRGTPESELKDSALSLPRIQSLVGEKTVRKIVCIPDKLVNIVI